MPLDVAALARCSVNSGSDHDLLFLHTDQTDGHLGCEAGVPLMAVDNVQA